MYEKLQTDISELYTYDEVDQITSLTRGVLNQDRTVVTLPNFTESWNFDKTGNWLTYDRNGTVENRTHNAANELQGIATHDANGNMTLMPGLKGKYDAWNRLVEVRDTSDNLIARYDYNGLNQRIQKTVGAAVTKSFFNEKWQELESKTGSELMTFVWGLRYIDDLVLRERGSERLYSLADPNWNVVAVVDSIGAVQERIKYDAFGKANWLDGSFVTKANSDFSWNRTFTGQIFDTETDQMLYRGRYYLTNLGRFGSKDPIEYVSGIPNLYMYVKNSPVVFRDPLGEDVWVENPGGFFTSHQKICVTTCDDCGKPNGEYCISFYPFNQDDPLSFCGMALALCGGGGRVSTPSTTTTTLPRLPGGIVIDPCGIGYVGEEPRQHGDAPYISRRLESDCGDDAAFLAFLQSLEGLRGNYNPTATCRFFANGCFDAIETAMEVRRARQCTSQWDDWSRQRETVPTTRSQ